MTTPALLTECAAKPGQGSSPARSAMFTTLPRAARSAGAAPWVQKKTERRLRSSIASYCAGVVSSNERCMHHGGRVDQHVQSAQLAPRRAAAARRRRPASVRSAAKQAARPPAATISVPERLGAGPGAWWWMATRHAAPGERPGQRLAQPPAGPRDERDPAVELHQPRDALSRGAIGTIWPVGAPGPPTASASTPRVRSSIST